MSTERRSSRLSQLSTPSKDESMMDVDEPSEEEAIEEIMSPKARKIKSPQATPKTKSKPRSSTSHNSGTDIFAALKGSSIMSDLAPGWVEHYCSHNGNNAAIVVLLSLLFECALVTKHPSTSLVADSSEEAVETFVAAVTPSGNTELPDAFPLQKTKGRNDFLKRYAAFWRTIVEEGSESAFASEHLLSRLLTWFNKIVHAPLRPLRYAGALTAFLLCEYTLVQLKESSELLAKRSQQKQSEARKKTKDAPKLQEDIKTLTARVATQEGLVKQIWTLVFTKCWNDKDPAIRQLCVEYFGRFCVSLPRIFMESDRFRFLVWLSADATPAVRIAAGKTFLQLLACEPLRHQLQTYCERLLQRFLNRVREDDEDIAISGIDILRTLRDLYGFDYVPDEIVAEVKRLISVDSPDIRRAVGQFVLPEIMQSKSSSHKSVKVAAQVHGQHVERTTALLEFIEESAAHLEMPAYVVDAVWDNKPESILFQFQAMAEMLSINTKLTEARQLLLARLIHATLKQLILPLAHTRERKASRSSFSVEGPACKPPVIKQLLERFTSAFYDVLPSLLTTHKGDTDILIPLLSLVKYMDLKTLNAKDDAKELLEQLTRTLKAIFTSTTSPEVMGKVARAYDHLHADPSFKYKRVADLSLRNAFDGLLNKMKELVSHFDEPGSSQKQKLKRRESNLDSSHFVDGAAPGTAPLVLCLLRLEALTKYFSLVSWDETTLETVMKVLETRNEGMLQLVGPRSASSAALIVGRLVCGTLERLLVDGNNDTSRMSESENYDVGVPHTDDEESESDEPATPSRRKAARARSGADGATPKKKSKKGSSDETKVFDALAVAKVPSQAELEEISRTVRRSIEQLLQMLSRTVDDTDVSDIAPLAAFQALSHILTSFSPQLEHTSLKPLAYDCPKQLEDEMTKTFEAEMERVDASDSSLQERLVDVFSQYARINFCGVLGPDGGSNLKRCAAQLLHPNETISKLAGNLISLIKKDKAYETPAALAQFFINTLIYEFERESISPDTPAFDTEEKQNRTARLAKRLAMGLPNIQKNFTPTVSKLVLDKLIQQVLLHPVSRGDLLLSAPVPFISKLSPTAAKELHSSLTRNTDHAVAGLGDDMENVYHTIKQAIEDRATGKKSRTATVRKDAAANTGEDDEDDFVETLLVKKPKATRAKKATSAAAKRDAPARGKRAKASVSVIHQGDDDSVTEDSEMAHTDDDASVHEERTPRTKPKPKRVAAASPKTPSRKAPIENTEDGSGEEEGNDMEEDHSEVPGPSQASVEMPLTDTDFLTPSAPRPKRGRSARQSQASQSSQKSEEDEGAGSPESDSDEMMEHTPAAKRRALPTRSSRK